MKAFLNLWFSDWQWVRKVIGGRRWSIHRAVHARGIKHGWVQWNNPEDHKYWPHMPDADYVKEDWGQPK